MIVFKQYNETYWSLVNLNDNVFKKRRKYSSDIVQNFFTDEEEKERVSLSRTKRRIKEICLCNDFEYFVTMTISSKLEYYNRFDLEDCVDNVKKLMKKIQRKSNDFKYIYIIEEHKKGGYHFHGFMKNLPENDIYKNKYGYLSSHLIDDLGYNSFSKIEDYNKCCNYITKYITKKCIKTDNNQIYFCSRGLKKPEQELMIECNLKDIFDKVYENDYIQKVDFDIAKLSKKQQIKLNEYFNKNDEFWKKEKNHITNWLHLFTNQDKYGKVNIIP